MRYAARLTVYAPNGAKTGLLAQTNDWNASFPYNDDGSITLDIAKTVKNYALIEGPCELAAEININGDWVEVPGGRFLKLATSTDELDPTGRMSLTCPSYGWILRKARLLPSVYDDAQGQRKFSDATAGTILQTLFLEAQARGALAGVTFTFTGAVDSAGQPWSTQISIAYSPGIDYSAILLNLAAQGMVDFVWQGRELRLYNADTTLSVDRTTQDPPVELRYGRDVVQAPDSTTYEDLADFVYVQGDGTANVSLDNPSAPTPWGRWENYISQGGVNDPGTLTVLAQSDLERASREKVEITRDLTLKGAMFFPFIDYFPGNYISTRRLHAMQRYRLRQITLRRRSGNVEASVVLNDRFAELEIRLAKRVDGIIGGATVSGGSGAVPIDPSTQNDTTIPQPPTDVLLGTAAYEGPDGKTLGQLTVSWTPVTLNTDGTAISDLAGYQIEISRGSAANYEGAKIVDAGSAVVYYSGLVPGATYYARVRAYDESGHVSAWVQDSIVIAVDTTPPPVPSTPTLDGATFYGYIRVAWDGLGSAGEPMSPDWAATEVHASEVVNFTPDATTKIDEFTTRIGGISGFAASSTNLTYFKFVSVDASGNRSAPSAEASATARSISELDLETTIQDKLADAETALATANAAQAAVNGKNKTFIQAAPPAGEGEVAGDLWMDSDDGYRLHRYDGAAWIDVQDTDIASAAADAANAVTAANNATTTANAAQTAANNAVTTANAAQTAANNAQTSADAANTAAANAQTAANTAETDAQSALTAANAAQTTANGKNRIYIQNAPPSGGTYVVDDVWFDSDDGFAVYHWSGSAWVAQQYGSGALAANSVTAAQITAGAVTTGKIAAGAVTANEIAANTITAAKIAANTITAAQIAAATITSAQIAAATIQASNIAADTITAAQIAAGAITSSEIAANAVTAAAIAANTITASKIAANTITAAEIAAATITSAQIAADTITAGNIAAGAVTASEIAAGAVTTSALAAGSVTAATIASGAITADKITVGTVSEGLLANGSFEDASTITGYAAAGWSSPSGATRTAGAGRTGSYAVLVPSSNSVGLESPNIPAAAGDVFALSGWAKNGPTSWGLLYLRLSWRNASNVEISYSDVASAQATNAAWTQYINSFTAPAGTVSVVVQVFNYPAGNNSIYFDDVDLRRVVLSAQIANSAITTSKLVASAVTANEIAAGAITTAKLSALSVTSNEIAALAVTTAKIAAGAVTANEIAAGTITTDRLAANAITAAKIAAGAVTATQLSANAISGKSVTGSIVTGTTIQNSINLAYKNPAAYYNTLGSLSLVDRWTAQVGTGVVPTANQAVLMSGDRPDTNTLNAVEVAYPATAGNTIQRLRYSFRDDMLKVFVAGVTYTLSFWSRATSGPADTWKVLFTYAPDFNPAPGTANPTYMDNVSATFTPTVGTTLGAWTRFSVTFTPTVTWKPILPENIALYFDLTSNQAAAHTLQVTGVQIEVGSAASAFVDPSRDDSFIGLIDQNGDIYAHSVYANGLTTHVTGYAGSSTVYLSISGNSIGAYDAANSGAAATVMFPTGPGITLNDNTGTLQIGSPGGANMALGTNTVQARNGNLGAGLGLNTLGGNVTVGSSSSSVTGNGAWVFPSTGSVNMNAAPVFVNQDASGHRILVLQAVASTGSSYLDCRNNAGTTVAAISNTGNVQGTGAYTNLSDRAAKTDIVYRPVQGAVSTINKLKPATYRYDTDPVDKVRLGFIAQDLQPVVPEAVAPWGGAPLDPTELDGFDLTTPEGQALKKAWDLANAVNEQPLLGTQIDAVVAMLVLAVQELAAKVYPNPPAHP